MRSKSSIPIPAKRFPDGEEGELVVTSLTREALPVIRFRTGDLTRVIHRGRCACGRTHLKIAGVTGRVDDMLIIKGVNFFPKQIEQSLLKIPGVHPTYQIIIEEEHGVRNLHINVEAEPGVTGYMIEKQLKEDLGFSPDGDVYAPGTLPRQEGKAKRVFHRKARGGEGMKELLSGNEAIARGAWEAGVKVVSGYPGTPSTEILENLVKFKDDVYCEWAPNEKVALEVAAGAAVTGVRSLVTRKHVGLNVAADPLMTLSYIGIVGGMVVIVADDPGMHSSQTEQDTRHYGRLAKLPVLEPAAPARQCGS